MNHQLDNIEWKMLLATKLKVVSYELQFAILRKSIDELRVPLYKLQSNFTSCKFVLPDGNKIMS